MYILGKARQNLEASSLLIENQLYAPSIHCSYYAGFQISKRKLLENGVTYEEQAKYAQQVKTDSHNCIINTTEMYVSNPIVYRHNMYKLKRLRKKSDYLNLDISESEAVEARAAALNILNVLA